MNEVMCHECPLLFHEKNALMRELDLKRRYILNEIEALFKKHEGEEIPEENRHDCKPLHPVCQMQPVEEQLEKLYSARRYIEEELKTLANNLKEDILSIDKEVLEKLPEIVEEYKGIYDSISEVIKSVEEVANFNARIANNEEDIKSVNTSISSMTNRVNDFIDTIYSRVGAAENGIKVNENTIKAIQRNVSENKNGVESVAKDLENKALKTDVEILSKTLEDHIQDYEAELENVYAPASSETIGMVYVGEGLNVDSDGVISVDKTIVKDGYTPVKGVDYWNENDIQAIKDYVDESILNGEW